jgi:hypothetical protein
MTGNGSNHRPHRRPSDEQRAFFEAILGMRDRYAHRGSEDAESVIGLRHAIVAATTAMAEAATSRSLRLGVARN